MPELALYGLHDFVQSCLARCVKIFDKYRLMKFVGVEYPNCSRDLITFSWTVTILELPELWCTLVVLITW